MLRLVNTAWTVLACGVSVAAILKHLKNYRKPSDQRLIVRILVMIPLFSLSAFLNLYCPWHWAANVFEFVRELYEPIVIYTFYSLLTNLLGGEREIIFVTTGRLPVSFPFGVKIDISDPHTFLMVKRLVMQYVYMRPTITVLMKLCAGSRTLSILLIILYNVSITLALNALMVFWVCLKTDLAPYRVVLKFLSVKMIVFFSYWQTLALSIIESLGLMSPESLELWSNSLVSLEAAAFSIVHWHAFPSSDYSATFMFGFARLRIDAAFRDAFGIADLVHDFRVTFLEARYGHRDFDSVEAVLDHPESSTRKKRLAAGLRYKNGGKSKYWLPKPSLHSLTRTDDARGPPVYGASHSISHGTSYGSTDGAPRSTGSPTGSPEAWGSEDPELGDPHAEGRTLDMEDEHSDEEEAMYNKARTIFGDYNYPVATVRESEDSFRH